METTETTKLENLRKLIAPYCNTAKSDDNQSEAQKAQTHYYELGCVITNLLKMCVLALDHEEHKISETNKSPINVSLILETVLEMLPLDEFELLDEINQIVVGNN
ncbi:hypothetical protein ACQKCJ_09575 [Flavobacterium sp. NPDC079362]|uniref:hypothetical protein n=1 Tax=Flavobacterium sp. NPDC079362 TaxID=3390566 RepID=UPI003D070E4D